MAERPTTSWRSDYIDQALTEHGIDVVALTDRHGLGRYQVTDKWRKW
ncbi:hypothetical protein ACFVT5_40240 [Streptomyces sp. NPDC058001]